MAGFLTHNLRHLANASGRDPRRRFWPWVGVVIALMALIDAVAMVPLMLGTMTRMQAFAAAHPDQATVTTGPGSYAITIHGTHPELMPDLSPFLAANTVAAVLAVLLLASAVVRRLHDCGRRGWWGLLPLPFLANGLMLAPRLLVMNGAGPDLRLFALLFVNNAVYLGCLAWLIVLLATPSQPLANRYGLPAG